MCKRTKDLVVYSCSCVIATHAKHAKSTLLFIFPFRQAGQCSELAKPFHRLAYLNPRPIPGSPHFCISRSFFFSTFFHQHHPRLLPRGTGRPHATRHVRACHGADLLRGPKAQKYVALQLLHWGGVWLAYLCSPQWHALVFGPPYFRPIWPHTGLMWVPVSLCPLNSGTDYTGYMDI